MMWVKKFSQTRKKKPLPSSPLLNPLILEGVFKHLDIPSLKEARLVSHLWNDEAAPILMIRSHINLRSPYKQWWDDSYLDHPENRYTDHDKLKDTLIHSPNPAVFFQNALLDFALLKNSKFLQMLQEFGHLLKSVEVRDCNFQAHFSKDASHGGGGWVRGTVDSDELRKYLHPMLTQYCKNLSHLKVRADCNHYDDDIISQSSLKIIEPLALESVDISGSECRLPSQLPPELNFLLDVIRASPKLKRLNFTAASQFVQFFEFSEGVSTLASVKNFEEFGWSFASHLDFVLDDDKRGNIMKMFQIISKMEMKELRILSLSNLTLFNPDMMVEFFKRNGKNLKTLILQDVCANFDGRKENAEPLLSTSKFEEILRFCSGIISICIKPAHHRADLMIDLTSLKLNPYPNLSKLVLGGYILKNIESFQAVVGWFPNLVYLNLDGVRFFYSIPDYDIVEYYDDDDPIGIPIADVDILDIVRALGSFQKLQEFVLRVDFSFKQIWSPGNLLAQIIKEAHCSPVLKILTIMDGDNTEDGEYYNYKMDDLKDALMQTKGFNCVQFANFRMNEYEGLNIRIFIDENHLPAKFVHSFCWTDDSSSSSSELSDDF